MKTLLTETLCMQHPIIQGAMAWCSESGLAAAVTMAGGLGTISSGSRTPEWLRGEIRKLREKTTLPFCVNIALPDPNREPLLQVVCDEQVPVVSLSGGKPPDAYYQILQAKGIKIIAVVATLAAARAAQSLGAAALVIEGTEGGGHIGRMTTMALMTEILPHVDIPVAAAGGIADGRGLAAALMMGAQGVQVGTAFMVAEECELHPRAKQRIVEATSRDIVVTGDLRRKIDAVRGIRNEFSDAFHKLQDSNAPLEEMMALATGTGRRGQLEGDLEHGFIMAGESISAVNKIRPAREIVASMVAEAEARLRTAASFL